MAELFPCAPAKSRKHRAENDCEIYSSCCLVKCNSPSSTFSARESRSQQQLASRRHHTIVLKAFKRSKKSRKHEINLNIFKKAETSVLRGSLHDHEHRCASNPSTMFEEKRKRNVCFNLNLLFVFQLCSETSFFGRI